MEAVVEIVLVVHSVNVLESTLTLVVEVVVVGDSVNVSYKVSVSVETRMLVEEENCLCVQSNVASVVAVSSWTEIVTLVVLEVEVTVVLTIEGWTMLRRKRYVSIFVSI